MTDDEVDDYVRFLQARLPPEHAHLDAEQVRAVLDAEAAYFERRFGRIHGWWALVRGIFGRGIPAPDDVEAALPEFEDFAVNALAPRGDMSRADVRAVMHVEGEFGPNWVPPAPPDSDTKAKGQEEEHNL